MPVVDGLPTPERGRHVPPRNATTGPPEHPVEDRAVIGPPPTARRGLVRQQRLQPGPFLVGQIMTMQHQKDLLHPALKIRGTRSKGAAALDQWSTTLLALYGPRWRHRVRFVHVRTDLRATDRHGADQGWA